MASDGRSTIGGRRIVYDMAESDGTMRKLFGLQQRTGRVPADQLVGYARGRSSRRHLIGQQHVAR